MCFPCLKFEISIRQFPLKTDVREYFARCFLQELLVKNYSQEFDTVLTTSFLQRMRKNPQENLLFNPPLLQTIQICNKYNTFLQVNVSLSIILHKNRLHKSLKKTASYQLFFMEQHSKWKLSSRPTTNR